MVSGAGETVDRIIGLEIGADDYLAKPFDPRELHARLKSVLRRYRNAPGKSAETGSGADKRVPFGVGVLDMQRCQLLDAKGREIPSTSAPRPWSRLATVHCPASWH